MARTASSALYVEGNDVLRFEESDDFGHYHNGTPPPQANGADEAEEDPSPAGFGNLKRTQAELLQLRQELEAKEREATALEKRRQKDERFATGRRAMNEQLSRTLVRLEREMHNAQKAIHEITL